MTKFNVEHASLHTAGASIETAQPTVHAAYVGLDVHKETVAIAVAEPGRQEPCYEGEIANQRITRIDEVLFHDLNGTAAIKGFTEQQGTGVTGGRLAA